MSVALARPPCRTMFVLWAVGAQSRGMTQLTVVRADRRHRDVSHAMPITRSSPAVTRVQYSSIRIERGRHVNARTHAPIPPVNSTNTINAAPIPPSASSHGLQSSLARIRYRLPVIHTSLPTQNTRPSSSLRASSLDARQTVASPLPSSPPVSHPVTLPISSVSLS